VAHLCVMRVWVDQPACVGNGICSELCPEVFVLTDGNIAYVHDGDRLLPEGPAGTLTVASELEDAVLDAVEECPAACIYIEPD
jgi:ferredoxin